MKSRTALRRGRERVLDVLAVVAIALIAAPLVSIGFTLVIHVFGDVGRVGSGVIPEMSVLRAIGGSLVTAVCAVAIAVPLAAGFALYIAEYTESWIAIGARASARAIDAAPPVLLGFALLGLFGHGLLGATVALALVLVPSAARATRDALARVPPSLREAATALGAPRFRGLVLVAWPGARRDASQALLRALSRALSEAAPLVVVTGALGERDDAAPDRTLSSMAYVLAAGGGPAKAAYAVALLLTAIVLVLHIAAARLERR